jgi:dipeptidase
VVALGPATAPGHTLFGQNSHRPARECQTLKRLPGREFAADDRIRTPFLELPQARKTYTVLGCQSFGSWGFQHGINEHQLAVGCAVLQTRLQGRGPGLLGTDVVRLTLERCRSARLAVDLLTDLVERYGQGPFPGCPDEVEGDHAFLIADPAEAFAVETAGNYWVYQEIHQLRAVSDVSVVHQDWDRIARGLAGRAIDSGWWPADGTKLDFAGALASSPARSASGLRRWGRASLLLEEQNGHIDRDFLRRLLADHYEGTRDEAHPLDATERPDPLCRHARRSAGWATATSLIASLGPARDHLPMAWVAFGPPCGSVYFPVFLEGELPASFACGGPSPSAESLWWRVQQLLGRAASTRQSWSEVRAALDGLQAHLDQEAEGLAAEGIALKCQGDLAELHRRAGYFMQHAVEEFDKVAGPLVAAASRTSARAGDRAPVSARSV